MGFPVVVGTKFVSSRLVAPAEPVEEFADDGIRVLRPSIPSSPTIFLASSPAHELIAIITLSYYDMINEERNEFEYSIADIRVQISRSTDAATMDSRDAMHRIRLRNGGNSSQLLDETRSKAQASSMAVFSHDSRFLTCVIPHPRGVDTTVVVFQLRKAKESTIRPLPPTPSYIPTPSLNDGASALVATNPRVLASRGVETVGEIDPLLSVTSMASIGYSLLLLGTFDGKILLVSHRPLLLLDTIYQHAAAYEDESPVEISAMDYLVDGGDPAKGRLAVLVGYHTIVTFSLSKDDEEQSVGQTLRETSSRQDDPSQPKPKVRLTETHRIHSSDDSLEASFAYIKWIANSYLAVLRWPEATCATSVFALYNNGHTSPVYTTVMSTNRLEEHTVTDFAVNVEKQTLVNGHHELTFKTRQIHCSFLDYDSYSDCIIISSSLLNPTTQRHLPFVYLWNWRANSQSFSAKAATHVGGDAICISSAFFARDEMNRRKLVHVVASAPSTNDRLHVRIEGYELALVSPPNQVARCGGRLPVHETSSLLLSATTISYPRRLRTSVRNNFEVHRSESRIPTSYVAAHGAPAIAAVGNAFGRNIAVASSRGLCTLSGLGCDRLYPGVSSQRHDSLSLDQVIRGNEPQKHTLLQKGFTFPRWHLFGNETVERAFSVVAMKWWEGGNLDSEAQSCNRFTDDMLVAVIQVRGEDRYYLSCWSCRSIEHSRQLLCKLPIRKTHGSGDFWGVPFLDDFIPSSLDVLSCPVSDVSDKRKACVLVADSSYSSLYQIYQLQVVDASNDGIHDLNRYSSTVYARLSASGMIGSQAQLFLASSSFSFDFTGGVGNGYVEKVPAAVVGVIHMQGGGLDAVSVQSSGIVAVGKVIETASEDFESAKESEVSRIWQSDASPNRTFAGSSASTDFFVWVVQLVSGRLVSWSVPFARSSSEMCLTIEPTQTLNDGEMTVGIYAVHPEGMSLGTVCPAGTSTRWMFQSASGTRDDFLAGHVPMSECGYVIGVAQSRKKLHRSTGSDFEKEIFRNDYFDHEIYRASDFALYPPGCLPSMFSLLLGTLTQTDLDRSHFGRYIHRRMGTRAEQTTTIMSLELMVIRATEIFTAISKQQNKAVTLQSTLLANMIGYLTDVVRSNTTGLQFATLYLKVARQIEPSCLPFLFPLPPTRKENTDDLFDVSLGFGSMSASVAALPLLEDGEVTKSMCVALFRYCLNAMDACVGRDAIGFSFSMEDRTTLSDVFRYAVKLNEQTYFAANDDDLAPSRGYSIMCGVSNLFSRVGETKKKFHQPLLVHRSHASITEKKKVGSPNVLALSKWHDYSKCKFTTVSAVVARFIVSSIFDAEGHLHPTCWQKIGALGVLLIGDSKTDFQYCTHEEFAYFAQSVSESQFGALLSQEYDQTVSVVMFLRECIEFCDGALDARIAGIVLDLLLVLLSDGAGDFHADVPGLLLVSIVVAHVSGRVSDISTGDDEESALWNTYLKYRQSTINP